MPNPVRRKPIVQIGNLSAADQPGIAKRNRLIIGREAFERTRGKTVFDMRMRGEIIPLNNVAADLGLSQYGLHRRTDIEILKIGKECYVTAAEAARIKDEYKNAKQQRLETAKRKAAETRQQILRIAKERKDAKMAEGRRQAAERTRKIEAEKIRHAAKTAMPKKLVPKPRPEKVVEEPAAKAAAPAASSETMKLIDAWMKKASKMEAGRRKLMQGLLSRSANLSPEEFREHVLPALARLMER